MKIRSIFKVLMVIATIAVTAISCKENGPDEGETAVGTVSGVVNDALGNPIEGVSVTVKDFEGSALTNADGNYLINDVPVKTQIFTFAKEGYQTASVTVMAKEFDAANAAVVNATLNIANAKVKGIIYDGENGNVPMEGAKVLLNGETVTTDAEGAYLFENLTLKEYTLTVSADGYISSAKTITEDMFDEDAVATLNVTIYKTALLPGLTLDDLKKADKWYYNEYRGGNGGTEYPRWDWSTAFMASLNYRGAWQEIGEGTDLMLEKNSNAPDLDNFESYVWGSKMITEDNAIMTVRARTFGDRDGETAYGVSVIDLSSATPSVVKIGDVQRTSSTDYIDAHFDLSDYIGKEIIVALGLYRAEKNESLEKHFAIKRINFTKEPMTGWGWIKGTDIPGLEGWHLTQEMVKSTMVQTGKEFAGITTYGDVGDRKAAKQSWRDNHHICHEWSFMALTKDTEIFAGQGALIKTRGGDGVVNTLVPESYFYTKFAVASGNNQLTFRFRNFSSNATFFKVTAITDDMTVKHLSPSDFKAEDASAADDGCWKFKNNKGEPNEAQVGEYASFTYDLSEFNGKDVVISIGVFKGEKNGDESKICFHSVSIN